MMVGSVAVTEQAVAADGDTYGLPTLSIHASTRNVNDALGAGFWRDDVYLFTGRWAEIEAHIAWLDGQSDSSLFD